MASGPARIASRLTKRAWIGPCSGARRNDGAYPGPVRTVEQIIEQIRAAAGADFAFVLTRKGRLVTYRAPRDMPEEGRDRLVRAARPLLGTDRVIALTLAREDLVPYGGAAPIDVYLGIAAEQAIVCVVMASWADKMRVAQALDGGSPGHRAAAAAGPAVGAAPRRRGARQGLSLGGRSTADDHAAAKRPRCRRQHSCPCPGPESLPSIHVGEAELGRLSMIAVHHDVNPGGSSPEITFGDAELGRQSMVAVRRELLGASSVPEIVLTGEVALGRESLEAILHEGKPRPTSSPEAIRIDLVSMPDLAFDGSDPPRPRPGARATMPWVEAASDTKRATEAAAFARNLVPPKVTLKLEDADEGVMEATRTEMLGGARAPQATLAYESRKALEEHAPAVIAGAAGAAGARAPQAALAYEAGRALEEHAPGMIAGARAPQATLAYEARAALEEHAPALLDPREPQVTLMYETGGGSAPEPPVPVAAPKVRIKPPPLPGRAPAKVANR